MDVTEAESISAASISLALQLARRLREICVKQVINSVK
jgi:hypothetical protein